MLILKPEGRRPLGKLCVYMMIKLKWALKKQNIAVWDDFNWLRIGRNIRLP
jgi:hypothetical protein